MAVRASVLVLLFTHSLYNSLFFFYSETEYAFVTEEVLQKRKRERVTCALILLLHLTISKQCQ